MEGVGIRSFTCNILGVEAHARAQGWGLGKIISESITRTDLHKPNNKLVNMQLEHFWCSDKPWALMNSQDSPPPKLGGNHHLPLYNFFVTSHKGYIQMSLCPKTSKLGVPKFSKLRLPQLCKPITFCANLRLK
jgi:hypothetical protein